MVELSRVLALGVVGAVAAAAAGCRDNSPPVPYTPPPAQGYETGRLREEPRKPMPEQTSHGAAPRPFDDEPLLVDTPPEARRFVEVYRQVGRPRIVVFVNRTLEGQMISAAQGSARTIDSGDEYLQRGQYDEVAANAIDYGMMEMLLTDWISADSQVQIVSPVAARRTLSKEQIDTLQRGDARGLSDVATELDADILIHVQARPTRQTRQGLEVRILAEALNIKGGDSIARAAVDMNPPLNKPALNKYTRFLARKIMDGMTTSWTTPQPEAEPKRDAALTPPLRETTPLDSTTQPRGGLGPRIDLPPPGQQ